MKPSSLFISLEDFSNRFKDTFIYYKGVPKYVHSCTQLKARDTDSLAFLAFDFEGGLDLNVEPQVINLNDEDVNFRQYNLGYVQYNAYNSMWCARMPARQWKQGLRKDQCQFVGYVEDDAFAILQPGAFTYNMLMNIYSSPQKAIETVKAVSGTRRSARIPIHKNFAIYGEHRGTDFGLEYKGINIAPRPGTGAKPEIIKDFQYLLKIPEYSRLLNGVVSNA